MIIHGINFSECSVKTWLALTFFGLMVICSCDSSEKVVSDSEEKSSYLYTGKLSEMQFTLFTDSVYKCYLTRAEFYIGMGGNFGRYDTIVVNTCKIADPAFQTRILDTIKEDTTRHKLWGNLSVIWEKPKNDSGWVKEVKISNDLKGAVIYPEFLKNKLNLYTTMEYYGEMDEFEIPEYFRQVVYTAILVKPDN